MEPNIAKPEENRDENRAKTKAYGRRYNKKSAKDFKKNKYINTHIVIEYYRFITNYLQFNK